MMVTTHALVGLVAAASVLGSAPTLMPVTMAAGYLGGLFPDLDLFVGVHRRTLHYPVVGWFVATPAVALALQHPRPWSVAIAAFLLAASLHAAMDILGAGDELRPWERTSDRGVYDHLRGRWLRPRYVVRYDGAIEDVALTVAAAIPAVVLTMRSFRWLTIGTVVVAGGYAIVRRRVPDWIERFTAA